MIKGLYTAASGMMTQMSRQDVIANNIANTSTNGFKKQIAITQAFPDMLISRLESKADSAIPARGIQTLGRLGTGSVLKGILTDSSAGNMTKTEAATDFSLTQKDCFFVVETEQGERYTRNGAFKIDSTGRLTDSQGNPVLDVNNNSITIKGEFSVNRQGVINFSDGTAEATIKVMGFDYPDELERIGDSLYHNQAGAASAAIPTNPEVLQGYLESSNVNAIEEMVDLLSVVRAYESMQKVVQAEDETTDVAINQVGSTS